ncbi:hypothetical protein D3C84_1000950 [compost metagenome]
MLFIGGASADDGLFDLGRGVLGDLQVFFRARHDRGAPGLPQLQSGVGIAGHEDLFDAHGHRFVHLDNLPHAAVDNLQTLMQFTGAGTDTAGGHVLAATSGITNHAITGNARTGVDTKN